MDIRLLLFVAAAWVASGDAKSVPVISVGKGSLEGIGIANKIRRFFRSGMRTKEKEEPKERLLIGDDVGLIQFKCLNTSNYVTYVYHFL